MASALFNTFHSLNTSASVFPVLTVHKYQQEGKITCRSDHKLVKRGSETSRRRRHAQDSGTQGSTGRKPCSPSADITFFSCNAGTCNLCTYKPQKQQKQKNKDNYCSKNALCCSPPSYILSSEHTRQSQILLKRASINQCI